MTDRYISLRAVIGIALLVVAFLAGWDAAALYTKPETFVDSAAYAAVFARADPYNIATFFAIVSVSVAVLAAGVLAGRDWPRWLVPGVLSVYALVVGAFADSIFDLGWTAGTGALKWGGWGASCFALGLFDLYRTSDRIGRMLDQADDAGFDFVQRDRGAIQVGAFIPMAFVAGIVVLAISDTVVLALVGLPGSLLTGYAAYRASRHTARKEQRADRDELETRLLERSQKARTQWLALETKYDQLRLVCRKMLEVLRIGNPAHPVINEAVAVLDPEE